MEEESNNRKLPSWVRVLIKVLIYAFAVFGLFSSIILVKSCADSKGESTSLQVYDSVKTLKEPKKERPILTAEEWGDPVVTLNLLVPRYIHIEGSYDTTDLYNTSTWSRPILYAIPYSWGFESGITYRETYTSEWYRETIENVDYLVCSYDINPSALGSGNYLWNWYVKDSSNSVIWYVNNTVTTSNWCSGFPEMVNSVGDTTTVYAYQLSNTWWNWNYWNNPAQFKPFIVIDDSWSHAIPSDSVVAESYDNMFFMLGKAFTTLGGLLSLQILPSITLATLFFMPVVVGLVLIIFKMLAK